MKKSEWYIITISIVFLFFTVVLIGYEIKGNRKTAKEPETTHQIKEQATNILTNDEKVKFITEHFSSMTQIYRVNVSIWNYKYDPPIINDYHDMRLSFEDNAIKIRDYKNTLKLELHLKDDQKNAKVGHISDVRNFRNIAFIVITTIMSLYPKVLDNFSGGGLSGLVMTLNGT